MDKNNHNYSDIYITGNEEFYKSSDEFGENLTCIDNYGGNLIKNIRFLHLEKKSFKHLSLKNCKFQDSSITHSYIYGNSYLRHSEFKNVNFTGTIFENTNLEKAVFLNCTLDYVKFENCILDYKEIIKCRPKETNIYMNLLKSLYKNELQQGNKNSADEIYLIYKKQESELYMNFLKSKKGDYDYNEMKRKGLSRFKVIIKLVLLFLSHHIWGHGIKIWKIFTTTSLLILTFSFIYSFLLGIGLHDALDMSVMSWFTNNEYIENSKINYIMYLENFCGFNSLALFTTALYRRIEK